MKERERTFKLSTEEKKALMVALREALSRRKEVLFAYVYGSLLSDLPVHDIDIGICVEGIAEDAATGYALDLSSTMQIVSNVPVDVRVINFAPLPFQYQVIRGELIFERDENARSSMLEDVMRRYLDIEPLLRRGLKEAFAA